MKIALAQMRMTGNVQENLEKSLKFCDLAEDCDLLFFPEIQWQNWQTVLTMSTRRWWPL